MKIIHTTLLVFFSAVFIFSFYWFSYREGIIREECVQFAKTSISELNNPKIDSREGIDIFEFFYQNCLRKNGLEK